MIALGRQDRILNGVLYGLLSLILAAVAYPLFFVAIASISDPVLVNTGKVWIIPRGVTLDGYARIVQHDDLLRGYRNSLAYATLGTLLNLALTLTAAYALSRRDLPGRNGIMLYLTFTMFFSGGLIPTFLLIRDLGLYKLVLDHDPARGRQRPAPGGVGVQHHHRPHLLHEHHPAGTARRRGDGRLQRPALLPLGGAAAVGGDRRRADGVLRRRPLERLFSWD